jgi:phosphoribosylamine--glycine ligase
MPSVGIVMGSDSDVGIMAEAGAMLRKFDIPYEMTVASAHRSPERAATYAGTAKARGIKVIIAGAGLAAHLAGSVAAQTTLPVIGVPIDAGPLNGFDALLSTVQMPPGIPVATVAIGKVGARNAGLLAVQILALADAPLSERFADFKKEMAAAVAEKAKRIEGSY